MSLSWQTNRNVEALWSRSAWVRLLMLGAVGLSACAPRPPADSMPDLVTHAVDPGAPVDAANVAEYLDLYVEGRSMVLLGESIHVTQEFPRARLQLVRRLHERHGFDVLAFEGTAIGSWLAQDHLYRSDDPPADRARRAQQLAWFGLWQTTPMLDVMEYVASSVGSPHPLYLASFDVQPGSSREFDGSSAKALDALFEAVEEYEPAEDGAAPARWRDAIAPILRCRREPPHETPAARQGAERAVNELQAWLRRASLAVARLRGDLHARALEDIPESLRASIELCVRVQGGSMRTYQETRDALNAQRAIDLRERVSLRHRVMLWAHHSHINYNATGKNPVSMGQHLQARLGDQLYSVGLFAGEGKALEIREGSFIEVAPRKITPARDYGVERLLASVAAGSYFLDLEKIRANESAFAAWFEPLRSRQEVRWWSHVIPARDFDAVIFVREVHSARLLMVPPRLERLLSAYGWLLDRALVLSVAFVASLAFVTHGWVRRRRARM
jgi:erythromycin esterase-like protein